jgi:hypothetical protein
LKCGRIPIFYAYLNESNILFKTMIGKNEN